MPPALDYFDLLEALVGRRRSIKGFLGMEPDKAAFFTSKRQDAETFARLADGNEVAEVIDDGNVSADLPSVVSTEGALAGRYPPPFLRREPSMSGLFAMSHILSKFLPPFKG
jgi:hypothetical protein